MTEDANRKATSAKEQAAQATQDALDKGQAHGESAWQKAKDAASHVYETVALPTSPFSIKDVPVLLSACAAIIRVISDFAMSFLSLSGQPGALAR